MKLKWSAVRRCNIVTLWRTYWERIPFRTAFRSELLAWNHEGKRTFSSNREHFPLKRRPTCISSGLHWRNKRKYADHSRMMVLRMKPWSHRHLFHWWNPFLRWQTAKGFGQRKYLLLPPRACDGPTIFFSASSSDSMWSWCAFQATILMVAFTF